MNEEETATTPARSFGLTIGERPVPVDPLDVIAELANMGHSSVIENAAWRVWARTLESEPLIDNESEQT